MRTRSLESRSRVIRVPVKAIVLALGMALGLSPLPAWSDVERTEAGRSTRTGPKGLQRALDHLSLEEPGGRSRESGRQIRNGRLLRAAPTEPISVGIVGCPGCTTLLQAIGGVFIERPARRRR